MSRPALSVVGAVIVREGLVLAAQRGPGTAQAGLWEFPGGKVEPEELPEAALIREIREELRCDISVQELIVTHHHTYDFGEIALSTYYATLLRGEPQAVEHAQLVWLPADQLRTLEWAPADIPTIERLTQASAG